MITPVDFSFVSAKLHGMRSKLYEGARLDALTSLRNPFELIAAVLPGTDVRDRMDFERRLVEQHVRDLNRVRTLLDGPNRAFFDWQLERYRMENVKVLLRAWKARSESAGSDVRALLVNLPEGYALSVDRLLSAAKLTDFMWALPGRLYAQGIKRGAVQFHDTQKLFFIEAGLDAVYFEELCRRCGDLETADREEVEELLRIEVLVYDVLFAVRGRLNLGLSIEDVGDFLVTGIAPAPGSVVFEAMLGASDFAGMLAAMPSRRTLLGTAEPMDLVGLQRALHERLARGANRSFYHSMFHMGAVEAFYYLKRIELANLIRVAELLRQERPAVEIRSELLRVGGS
jgi:vacuolar-type H+-ATPase subunit C/Vma6